MDATKERDLGKKFKIEGFPTGKYRLVSIRSSFNAITDIFSSLTSRLPQVRKMVREKKMSSRSRKSQGISLRVKENFERVISEL